MYTYRDDDYQDLLSEFGAPVAADQVPSERYDQYGKIFPPLLLRLWKDLGFAGIYGGRFWLCDPVAWKPAVDAWTANLDLAMGPDTYHAFARNAFGAVYLWGERTGSSLHIDPVFGMIYPTGDAANYMSDDRVRDNQIDGTLSIVGSKSDLLGSDEKPLFERALKAHGQLSPSTLYSFVPAYGLGGPLSVDHIEIADAPSHVELLADLTEHRTMGDITMSPIAEP